MRIVDIRDMPGYDGKVLNGVDSVTRGLVYWDERNKASCKKHGAMLCVSKDRRIWRCPACHVGLYVEEW